MQHLIDLLHQQECSLVVKAKTGEVTTYNKKGVRDLVGLLDHDAERLCGAVIADKVIGKAAAGLIVQGGVVEAYAEVMSRLALPLLDKAGIAYRYGQLVDHIVIPEGDTRCPPGTHRYPRSKCCRSGDAAAGAFRGDEKEN